MRYVLTLGVSLFVLASAAEAQKPPLLPEKDVAALANELSGETAKRNLEGVARFHRQRGSQGFHAEAELVAERLRAYGLSDVAILQFQDRSSGNSTLTCFVLRVAAIAETFSPPPPSNGRG